MTSFFQKNHQNLLEDIIYFYKKYPKSIQGYVQQKKTENKKEIFEQAIYCFLTPATKSDSADHTIQELLKDDFFYKAKLEEITACLKKPPYIRFHNQKAERLILWQQNGAQHIDRLLLLDNAYNQRLYLVENVKGLDYKEATHFLRNIGRSDDLVILDRHIINFMKIVEILSEKDNMSKLSKNYLKWEQLFINFIKSNLWINTIGHSSIPRADFAIWAASVKESNPLITYERIMELR